MRLNKICNVEDFTSKFEIDTHIAFPHIPGDIRYRKYWEWMIAYKALTKQDSIWRLFDSVLGVGAGYEAPVFAFTQWDMEVHATDIYLTPGWDDYAPADFMLNPDKYAPFPYNRQRLIIQHMDARDLRYPDCYFDGVFSSSSIEHFGTLTDMIQASKEMARVVKPGGVIALTTEFDINDHTGYLSGNTFAFNAETLHDLIIEPSGCELIESLDYAVSEATRATAITLEECMHLAAIPHPIEKNSVPAPHIVISHNGFEIAPIGVVMRKSA